MTDPKATTGSDGVEELIGKAQYEIGRMNYGGSARLDAANEYLEQALLAHRALKADHAGKTCENCNAGTDPRTNTTCIVCDGTAKVVLTDDLLAAHLARWAKQRDLEQKIGEHGGVENAGRTHRTTYLLEAARRLRCPGPVDEAREDRE